MFNDPQFWVFIAFIIFIGVTFNPARKMLSTSLDGKIQEIKNSIDEAEKLKKDTQLTLSEIKKRQNEVKDEISSIYQETKDKIIVIEKNASVKLKEQINKRNTLTSTKITQMIRDANIIIQEHITDTAIAAVINILEEKLNDQEKQSLIKQSISEVNLVIKN